jgi:YNFM family putative membrane transporter
LALSLSTGFLAVAILFAGAVSEVLGRRGLMFASICAAACLNIAAALVPDWHALLVARALEGLLLGGVPAVAMAYLAEEMHPRGLGLAMGLYVSGTAFGGMIGRVGIGVLTEWTSWRMAMGTVGVVGLLAAMGFIALLPPSSHFVRRPGFDPGYHIRAWAKHLGHPGLPLLVSVGFLMMGAFVTVYNYVGFRLMAAPFGLGQTAISLVFMAYLFGIAASSAGGALADRLGRSPVMSVGIAISALGLALTLSHSLWCVFAGIVALTFGFLLAVAVAIGWVGRLAQGLNGHAASLYLWAYYLGSSVMGSVGGWFWAEGGWPAVVAFAGALIVLALVAARRLRSM